MKIFILLVISVMVYSQSYPVKTYIPERAFKYMPMVHKESLSLLGNEINPSYFDSLIEQESCVRLGGNSYWARKCWNPTSELKTSSEQGIGLSQVTRAWKKDGRLRFDTLENLRRKYPKELHELTWNNIKEKPELQIRAMALLWRDNYRLFSNNILLNDRIAFSDSVYNGGFKYLNRERATCKLTVDCNSSLWFKNVELIKSGRVKRKLYGNRTAWDINRNHVKNVLNVRWSKYKNNYNKKNKKDNINVNNNDINVYQVYQYEGKKRFYGE